MLTQRTGNGAFSTKAAPPGEAFRLAVGLADRSENVQNNFIIGFRRLPHISLTLGPLLSLNQIEVRAPARTDEHNNIVRWNLRLAYFLG